MLGIARIAGIQAAKKTSDLIPLCHPLALTRVAVAFALADAGSVPQVVCTATVETVGPTGVEMEALTAVQVALLTIYDMCKAVDRGMRINDVYVLGEARRQVRQLHGAPPQLIALLSDGPSSASCLSARAKSDRNASLKRPACALASSSRPSSSALSISLTMTRGSG